MFVFNLFLHRGVKKVLHLTYKFHSDCYMLVYIHFFPHVGGSHTISLNLSVAISAQRQGKHSWHHLLAHSNI